MPDNNPSQACHGNDITGNVSGTTLRFLELENLPSYYRVKGNIVLSAANEQNEPYENVAATRYHLREARKHSKLQNRHISMSQPTQSILSNSKQTSRRSGMYSIRMRRCWAIVSRAIVTMVVVIEFSSSYAVRTVMQSRRLHRMWLWWLHHQVHTPVKTGVFVSRKTAECFANQHGEELNASSNNPSRGYCSPGAHMSSRGDGTP